MAHPTLKTVLILAFLSAALCAAAYTPDTPPKIDIADTQETGSATIVLETNVSGADIYLNRVFIGRTPHIQKGLPPGVHVVRLELDGYRPRELVLDLQEKRTYTIKIVMVPRTGWLSVSAAPADARISVDGSPVSASSQIELPIGPHRVSAYLFGYEEASQNVYVLEDSQVSASFTLKPAAFEVSELRVRRHSFNPINVAALGAAEVRFSVTSFGHAEMEVRNASGELVERIEIPPFTESLQRAVWKGRDEADKPLPDGEYTIVLRASPEIIPGEPAPAVVARSAKVSIDSTLVIAPRALSAGVSGLSLYPDPFVDPARTLRFSAGWKPILGTDGALGSSAILLGAQVAMGGFFEIALQGAFDPESSDSLSAGLGVKRTLFSTGAFSAAAYLAAAYCAGSIAEEPGAPSAARFGLSGAFGNPLIYGGLALEIDVPSWDDSAPVLSARAGFSLSDGVRSAGISARVRTQSLSDGFAISDSVSAVLEARTFLAPLPVTMGISLGADFGSEGVLAFRPGFEFSVIF